MPFMLFLDVNSTWIKSEDIIKTEEKKINQVRAGTKWRKSKPQGYYERELQGEMYEILGS